MTAPHTTLALAGFLFLTTLPVMADAAVIPASSEPAPHSDNSGFYAGPLVGNGFSWIAGGEVGYKTGPIRIEGEFAYMDSKTGDFHTRLTYYLGMINVMRDFTTPLVWVNPYVGVGLGGIRMKYDDYGMCTPAAIQGLAGLSLPVTHSLSLFVDYRYITTITSPPGQLENYQTHTANVGAILYFDL